MDQGWLTGEPSAVDESSFPREREPRADRVAVALGPRLRWGDSGRSGLEGRRSDLGGDAHPDWATVLELTFTANGLAG
jgi:hypothetical protein